MNLPKGPDTLCFDKDEFMKVRPGPALPELRRVACLPFPTVPRAAGPRTPRVCPRRDLAALVVSLLASGGAGEAYCEKAFL